MAAACGVDCGVVRTSIRFSPHAQSRAQSRPRNSPGSVAKPTVLLTCTSRQTHEKLSSSSNSSDGLARCLLRSKSIQSIGRRTRHGAHRHVLAEAAASAAADSAAATNALAGRAPEDVSVVVVGATGYIGKFVTRELVRRGYNVTAVTREKSGIGGKKTIDDTKAELEGADVVLADVTSMESLAKALDGRRVDAVVSCLASRTGGIKDSWLIDYTATKNALDVGVAAGASHFVLLSAICVQKPLLEFQRAKLKFEADLIAASGITHSIVRPTAFFKSLGGQVESVKGGGPYVMFGDGQLCACKPISESDLASFIADCVTDPTKTNQTLPIGGPGDALTPLQQGQLLFDVLGKEPKFIKVPIEVMDFAIGVLDFLAARFKSLEDAAEFAKIGRYYAAESMLVYDAERGEYDASATPSYGSDTLEAFFKKAVTDGMAGQELGDQAVFGMK